MSIATRTGDDGSTGLMYNRRVSKTDPRVEAYGTVDELNTAIGMARATGIDAERSSRLVAIQKLLVTLMGELATLPSDLERYGRDGFETVKSSMTAQLDEWVRDIESRQPSFKGWATPGANLHAGALDLARTTCRRAERRVCGLLENGGLPNHEIVRFLNRLADLLWLMAREAESSSSEHRS